MKISYKIRKAIIKDTDIWKLVFMQLKVIDIVYMSEISFTTREICWFLFKREDYINISVKLQEAHFADFQIKFAIIFLTIFSTLQNYYKSLKDIWLYILAIWCKTAELQNYVLV